MPSATVRLGTRRPGRLHPILQTASVSADDSAPADGSVARTHPAAVDAMDDVVRRLGGAAKTVELRTAGFSKGELGRAVRSGRLVRPRKAWYVAPGTPPDLVAAVRVGGRATCVTALRHHGVWITDHVPLVHVAVHREASRLRAISNRRERQVDVRDAVVHWRDTARPRQAAPSRLLEPVGVALRDAFECLHGDDLFATVESALHLGVVSMEGWRRILATASRARRTELADASRLSGSGVESLFVRGVRRLPIRLRIRQQVQIGPDRVDTVLGDRLVVELDSERYHDLRADRRRDARLALAGYAVLRFDHGQVLFDWPTVEAVLVAALVRGDHLR